MTTDPSSPSSAATLNPSPTVILHHDVQKQHHTPSEAKEYNIFRDSAVRYLGYANEVGESFRYQFPRFVLPSYVISFGYCFADAVTSGQEAYEASSQNESSALLATTDTLLWQSLASVLIPGATINAIVKASRYAVQHSPRSLPSPVALWLPTAIGLGSIPLIVHPIDQGVDFFMENTFRKYFTQTTGSLQDPNAAAVDKSITESSYSSGTLSVLSNALGSASAGIIARISTHPLDTAKARLQSLNSTTTYRGPLDVLWKTFRSEGLGGWYRGFSTVIVGGTPGTIVYLCSYDMFKTTITDHMAASPAKKREESFWVHFSSGILAESVACLIYVPVDVVKERLQVQQKGDSFQYKGGWDALMKISKNEGLSGIYKGYGATLASFGPFSAFYFMFYEKFKVWSKEYLQTTTSPDSTTLPFPLVVLSSASAGALASFLTSPLDMAKLRLQVQRGAQNSTSSEQTAATNYRGMADALRYAYQSGGVRGLFRGAGARVLHFVPATTITMTTYETCREMFYNALQERT
ncbi:mitochondrial carrier protein [Nitzschia inconspicua]|uniref:Mitochondrial carrier protein n=1 Tax=Nitzschia inconspicua TaxID=303405 RepID=A0A9K3L1Z8_9STRA|nr:mitochondrial carrier protein [Nitzschia inconspicua]